MKNEILLTPGKQNIHTTESTENYNLIIKKINFSDKDYNLVVVQSTTDQTPKPSI
jgi:hypothetical protein